MRDINLIMNDIKDLSDEVQEFVERVPPLLKSLAREAAAALDEINGDNFDDNDFSEAENVPQDAMTVTDFLEDVEFANRYLTEDTTTAQRIFS